MSQSLSHALLKILEPGPQVQARIDAGIRQNRMCDVTLRVVDPVGRPVPGVRLELRQLSHDFRFGCNCFMLDEGTPQQQAQYAQLFAQLFNLTVVPLYWSDLEPQEHQLRFAPDSPRIYRRPPLDKVLDWCAQHNIEPKGHPLVWYRFWPEWARGSEQHIRELLDRRIGQIARHVGQRITQWDVVNEAFDLPHDSPLPRDFVFRAFEEAARHLPPTAKLFYNEAIHNSFEHYRREYSMLYLLLKDLLARGARLDGIGIQFHFWSPPEKAAARGRTLLDPAYHLRVLDLYGEFARPIHISEISIPTWSDESLQAALVRGLYRTWFSHPSVQAIIWWNLPDGGAETGNENNLGIGLLTPDYTPKAAYRALDELINHEWRTNAALTTDPTGQAPCRLFPGEYELTLTTAGRCTTHKAHLRGDQPVEVVA